MARRHKMQPTMVIGAALEDELLPVARALGLVRSGDIWEGELGKRRVVAGVSGMGGERAARAAERWIAEYQPDLLIWMGFCGGLDPSVPSGTVVRPKWLIDDHGTTISLAKPLASMVPSAERKGNDTTIFHSDQAICTVETKHLIHERHAASAVDMESLPVAQVALKHQVKFDVYRAVLDDANTLLPAQAANWVTADGRNDTRAAMMYLMRRPWALGKLVSLGLASRRAGRSLAQAVHAGVIEHEANDLKGG